MFQYKLRRFIESIGFRLLIAVLFVTDLVIIITSTVLGFKSSEFEKRKPMNNNFLFFTEDTHKLDVTSLILSIIFMLDICLRILAQG